MLIEKGNIVAVAPDHLNVEVIQQTTCGSCAAQKGCGQGVLSKYLSGSQIIRINLKHRPGTDFQVGDQVELGIDEFAMLRAAFLVYLSPLFFMLIAAYLGALISEAMSVIFALSGLALGGGYVRWKSSKKVDDPGYTPIIVDDRSVVRIFSSEPARFRQV